MSQKEHVAPISFGDQEFGSAPVYLTDLDRCRPQHALTDGAQRGRWRMINHETDALSGVMLMAGPETGAAQVTYPLDLVGWHAVSIGAYVMPGVDIELQVKLSDDKASTILTLEQFERHWPDHSVA